MTEVTENTLPGAAVDLAEPGSEILRAMDERYDDPEYMAEMDATGTNLAHEAGTAETNWDLTPVATAAQDMAPSAGHDGYVEAFHGPATSIIESTVSTTPISAALPVDLIPLATLRLDGGTQSRVSIDKTVIAEYADSLRAGQELPPVVAFFDGVNFWLADGFHRFHAHAEIGAFEIPGYVHTGTRRDAVLYSKGANRTHGLPRSNADKRKAVTDMLEDAEWGQWSDNAIARQCGVSPTTVGTIRASLSKLDSEKLAERTYTTKHGTKATMKTAKVGKTKPEKPSNSTELESPTADQENLDSPANLIATPRPTPEQGAVAVANVDALVAENKQLRAELGELAEQFQETLTEAETMRKVIEANEPLAEAVKLLKQAQELNRVLETRVQGLTSEKNEILRRYKGARHELDRLKQAHAGVEVPMAESAALGEKLAAALDEVASLKTELANALDSLDDIKCDAARTLDDNEMMGRVFDADDRIKASMAEVARYRAVAEHAERTLAARAQEYNERARLVSYWKKHAEKAEKQLAKTN